MNIYDIKFPSFTETWDEYCERCPIENPFHFVLVDNTVLTQYIDGYLCPVSVKNHEDSTCNKNMLIKAVMKTSGSQEIRSRITENYPPYCMLFTVPNRKDFLTVVLRTSNMYITEMTTIGYAVDYDCFVGEIRLPYGHREDSQVYLPPKDLGLELQKEQDYKKIIAGIRDNGIFVGTRWAYLDKKDNRLCKGIRVDTADIKRGLNNNEGKGR